MNSFVGPNLVEATLESYFLIEKLIKAGRAQRPMQTDHTGTHHTIPYQSTPLEKSIQVNIMYGPRFIKMFFSENEEIL